MQLELVNAAGIRQLEPNVTGTSAILVHETGIVSYRAIAECMAHHFSEAGGQVLTGAEVVNINESNSSVDVDLKNGSRHRCRFLVTCGGLQADRLARMAGIDPGSQIIPYRGQYYRLPESRQDAIRRLIYPVPDPDLPFLGVHLTRMIDGSVTIGPNAVQAWKREGYEAFNFSLHDTWEMSTFPGFWSVSRKHLRAGLAELRDSIWKRGYLRRVRKLMPDLESGDLLPHPCGIRAQAVMADGTMAHDFLFAESPRSLHVCSAPSPGATSAIPVGEYLKDKVLQRFEEAG